MRAYKLVDFRTRHKIDEWEVLNPDAPETAYIEECEERANRVLEYAKQAKKKKPIEYKE